LRGRYCRRYSARGRHLHVPQCPHRAWLSLYDTAVHSIDSNKPTFMMHDGRESHFRANSRPCAGPHLHPVGVHGLVYFMFHVIKPEVPPSALAHGAASRGGVVSPGLMTTVKSFFEVTCGLVGEILMLPGRLLMAMLLASGMTVLPRWTALVTPGPLVTRHPRRSVRAHAPRHSHVPARHHLQPSKRHLALEHGRYLHLLAAAKGRTSHPAAAGSQEGALSVLSCLLSHCLLPIPTCNRWTWACTCTYVYA
jgi:hypothetical protein